MAWLGIQLYFRGISPDKPLARHILLRAKDRGEGRDPQSEVLMAYAAICFHDRVLPGSIIACIDMCGDAYPPSKVMATLFHQKPKSFWQPLPEGYYPKIRS